MLKHKEETKKYETLLSQLCRFHVVYGKIQKKIGEGSLLNIATLKNAVLLFFRRLNRHWFVYTLVERSQSSKSKISKTIFYSSHCGTQCARDLAKICDKNIENILENIKHQKNNKNNTTKSF